MAAVFVAILRKRAREERARNADALHPLLTISDRRPRTLTLDGLMDWKHLLKCWYELVGYFMCKIILFKLMSTILGVATTPNDAAAKESSLIYLNAAINHSNAALTDPHVTSTDQFDK